MIKKMKSKMDEPKQETRRLIFHQKLKCECGATSVKNNETPMPYKCPKCTKDMVKDGEPVMIKYSEE